MTAPRAIIVDIDGTLALHGDERGHFEYEKVGGDQPNAPIIELVLQLWDADRDLRLIFMSGREDRCRDITIQWIADHMGNRVSVELDPDITQPDAFLFMRTTGDHRQDAIIKRELYDEHVAGQYDVWLVLEDRDQMVRMWRDLGLTCLQVADGAF